MKGKSLKRLRINWNMILIMKGSLGLSFKTNWSNWKISLVAKMWDSQNYSSKSTIFCIRTRIFLSKMRDSSINWPVSRNFMEERSISFRLNWPWSPRISNRPLFSTTGSSRNSRRRVRIMLNNWTLSSKGRSRI